MPGALALPSTCLRCQLHAAVLQTGSMRNVPRHIAQRCQAFSTQHSRSQEASERLTREKNKRSFKWRSIALSDEESGARRKPIIVLDHKPKSKVKAKNHPPPSDHRALGRGSAQDDTEQAPSAKQIESVVSEKHKLPSQSDVNASLEVMRVEATKKSTVISTSKFEALLQDLARGYTVQQLGRYLERSIKPPSNKVYELQTSPWRPGRTPITHRLPRDVKKKGPSTKMRIAEQILRLVWEVTVESEENRDGELEIRLKPWQLSLLFDLTINGTRHLESLVTPPTLVQNSEIQVYRPDNVMRITGRCQTAEEVARQLQLALLKVHRLEWDLKSLPLSSKASERSVSRLFRDEDVRYVAQLTETVIMPQDDGVLAIYCANRPGTLNARRLLLALLDQNRGSFDEITSISHESAGATLSMPVGKSKVGVHRRYHGLELWRAVRPVPVKKEGAYDGGFGAETDIDTLASSLARRLDSVAPFNNAVSITEQSDSYWRELNNSSAWKATFCTLLQLKHKSQIPAGDLEGSTLPRMAVQHAIPGLENLLSSEYFEPSKDFASRHAPKKVSHSNHNQKEKMQPYIKVHLKPSLQDPDFTAALPHLVMLLRFSESISGTGPRELTLTGMHAILDKQCLSVQLPDYATDARFARKTKLQAKLGAVKSDASIMTFVRQLQKSARSEKGALTAPAELVVKLPSGLAKRTSSGTSTASPDVKVKYLFERFEQIQRLDLVPRMSEEQDLGLDEDVKPPLASLPRHSRLDYREIEGGAIYGNSTVLSLNCGRREKEQPPSTAVEEQSDNTAASSSLELAGSALRLAHLLMHVDSGSTGRNSEETKDS